MNLRDLKYLLAVAELQHFGRAAEACFVSQPTLSGQIKKLEEELGVVIFERSNRSVRITPLGEQMLQLARRAVEQVDAMHQLAESAQDPLSGPLRLGVIPTLGPYLMPSVLRPLREDFPRLQLILREEITDLLLEHLRTHDLDVALIATQPDQEDLIELPLFDEPFWLALPVQHRLYNQDIITEDQLPVDELLLLADGHCLSDQVMGVCGLQQANQTNDLRAASLETLVQLVGASFGCTLIPALSLGSSWATDTGVVVRQLDVENAERRVRLVTRKTFPHREALHKLGKMIQAQMPNTVRLCTPEWLG